MRLAQRSGQWVLTKTEGKPALRVLAFAVLLGVGGLLLYVWIPKGNYSPIRRHEKGTISQGVLALNPKNISHLHNLPPPPDLSSHDRSPSTTVAPTPSTTVPRYTTQTTSRYTTQTTRYTTQTTYYTTQTTSGYTTQTTG
ncbi:MAG: hypothetical protein JOZ68_05010 [Acidimicrobiia bacterium]|nr:hypothetical protein [Acidimicrobiia bacterium]